MTGFLGKGLHTGAITTLGRGGSDLSATVLGAALELDEVQVWKDVDGECVWGGRGGRGRQRPECNSAGRRPGIG